MILGREETVIDDKGRIRLPKKMQDALGDAFVLWVHPDGYVAAFPKERWNLELQEVLALPMASSKREKLLRVYAEFAETDVSVDQQGRFVLPKRIRQYAQLDTNEIVLKGSVDHLQIWALEADQKLMLSPEERKSLREEFSEEVHRQRQRS